MWSLLLAAALGFAGPADAIPVKISVRGELPFSATELSDAVAARLPLRDGGDAREVVVRGDADGVTLDSGERQRTVDVGTRTGIAAARVVALAMADLVEEARPEPLSPLERLRAPLELSLGGGVGKGVGELQPTSLSLSLGVILPFGDRFRTSATVAWAHTPRQDEGTPTEAVLDRWTLRLGAGVAFGPVVLQAGPLVSPYALGGALSQSGVLVGAGVWGRASVPVASRFRIAVDAGADVYANQVVVEDLSPYFETPRFAVWGSLAVVVEIDR